MIKILFIADKWCAGNKNFGVSEWENNLHSSLKASIENINLLTFHYDEYFSIHGVIGDKKLLQIINEFQPDLVFLVIYKMPSSDLNVPTWETLSIIKKLNIPIVNIWGDLEMEEQVAISKAVIPYISFNVATASSAAVERIKDPKHYIYMWVPKDPTYFNDPEKERGIDISYSGSPKKNRLSRIQYLKKNSISVISGGGERQEHKTTSEYAEIYQQSKIALSFSRANLSHVVNARPFEAMLCGAMLLEQENFELPKMYIPFIDYVPYVNNKDLVKKVHYFLLHNDEREKIAKNGRNKTQSLYSAKRFWTLIIEHALHPSLNTPVLTWKLTHESLALIPWWQSYKLQLLNYISCSPTLFSIYKLFLPHYYQEIVIRLGLRVKPFLIKKVTPRYYNFILAFKRKLW